MRKAFAIVLMVLLQACGGSDDGGGTPPTGDTTAPSVPAGLIASPQSTTQIQLSWQASTDSGTGVAGYQVFRGATSVANVSTTSYMDSGLTPATTYTYTVHAYDAAVPANVSAPSATVSATTQTPGDSGNVSGLDARPSNAACLAGDAPSGTASISVERVFAGLPNFSEPLLMLQAPGSGARWFVVEKGGRVYSFDNQPGVTQRTLYIDLTAAVAGATSGEQGLLGMAFHPGWPANPRVYFSHTTLVGGIGLVSRVVEYRTRDGGSTLDPGSGTVVLQIRQPMQNHNGGHIAFGPDGYLYIGMGDGGSAGDAFGTFGNGQRLSTLLGKMLRIDVSTTPYSIPADNPFNTGQAVCNDHTDARAQNCPEIHAYGLRNPWRWSFDTANGNLWLGDVGQGRWEEVNRIARGGNYGWRCFEGVQSYNSSCGPNAGSSLPPVVEYGHTFGASITGGFVYRGGAIPALRGRYVFGDFVSGRVWHVAGDTAPTLRISEDGLNVDFNISSFGQDHDGEIYVVNFAGTLHRLRAGSGGGGGRQIPALLSDTGCVSTSNPAQPASGLIPYSPNAPFWSDGATKSRYLALPDGQRITVDGGGDFDFPSGSVLIKQFRLGGRLVETRLFMRHNNGEWAGYTYEWNTQETNATRVIGGKAATINGQSWLFPSEAQCLQCHTQAAGRSLGLEIAQLNGQFGYPAPGRTANQLTTLDTIGLLAPPLASPHSQLPALPDPLGTGTLTERARAYLHTNCSHCHRPGGPTTSSLDLRYTTALANTNACNVTPANTLGIQDARIIAVGGSNPAARSVLVARPGRTDADAMPPLLPRLVDTTGVALLTQWVNSLTSCN